MHTSTSATNVLLYHLNTTNNNNNNTNNTNNTPLIVLLFQSVNIAQTACR